MHSVQSKANNDDSEARRESFNGPDGQQLIGSLFEEEDEHSDKDAEVVLSPGNMAVGLERSLSAPPQLHSLHPGSQIFNGEASEAFRASKEYFDYYYQQRPLDPRLPKPLFNVDAWNARYLMPGSSFLRTRHEEDLDGRVDEGLRGVGGGADALRGDGLLRPLHVQPSQNNSRLRIEPNSQKHLVPEHPPRAISPVGAITGGNGLDLNAAIANGLPSSPMESSQLSQLGSAPAHGPLNMGLQDARWRSQAPAQPDPLLARSGDHPSLIRGAHDHLRAPQEAMNRQQAPQDLLLRQQLLSQQHRPPGVAGVNGLSGSGVGVGGINLPQSQHPPPYYQTPQAGLPVGAFPLSQLTAQQMLQLTRQPLPDNPNLHMYDPQYQLLLLQLQQLQQQQQQQQQPQLSQLSQLQNQRQIQALQQQHLQHLQQLQRQQLGLGGLDDAMGRLRLGSNAGEDGSSLPLSEGAPLGLGAPPNLLLNPLVPLTDMSFGMPPLGPDQEILPNNFERRRKEEDGARGWQDERGGKLMAQRSLSDVVAQATLVEMATDQHGSRFIQQRLETASYEDKHAAFLQLLPETLRLCTDVFGNYVIQKLLEHGTSEHKRILASVLRGHVLALSLHMFGCRVVQKALDVCDAETQHELVRELAGHVMTCVKDQNGNHVIQKCIERVPAHLIQFVVEAFTGQILHLSTHPYGCRVIQRLLEHCTEGQRNAVLHEILAATEELCKNQYGNYVVQHVLIHGSDWHRAAIIGSLRGKVVRLSRHKFASNVVEKCFAHACRNDRTPLIAEVLGKENDSSNNSPLVQMVKDQYANYVVQKMIDVAEDDERQIIVARIRKHVPNLRKIPYGKHIISRVENLTGKPLSG